MTLAVDIRHQLGAFALDASFAAPGGVTAIFGRSGAGKSSVVNAVAGLLRPQAGRISLGEVVLFDHSEQRDLPRHQRGVGYVFQDARLFPHMSVATNIRFGGRFAKPGPNDPDEGSVVDLLGIGPLLSRRPATLSGGEAQRVALARALLSAPRLLLLDEPLAALDQTRRDEVLPYLERIRDETGVPMLYVSHSVAEVARLATTVVLLDEGKVQRVGPPEEVLSDPLTALDAGQEIGALLTAVVARHHKAYQLTELTTDAGSVFVPQGPWSLGRVVRIRVSASDVMISLERPEGISALNVLAARVIGQEPLTGPGCLVRLAVGEDVLNAQITKRSAEALQLSPGTACHAVIKSMRVSAGDIGSRSI